MTDKTTTTAEPTAQPTPSASQAANDKVLELKRQEKIVSLGLTYADLEKLGVDIGKFDDDNTFSVRSKIPGLELTWEDAQILGLDMPGGIKILQDLKKGNEYPLFFIPGQSVSYVFRGCTRQEWNQFLKSMKDLPKKRRQLEEQGEDPGQIESMLKALIEERTVHRFLVYPELNVDQIKMLLPGEVSSIHDSYMLAIGFGPTPQPIKL